MSGHVSHGKKIGTLLVRLDRVVEKVPGGTFDRLIANLLEMKASQFRVSHEDIEHDGLRKPAND